ncbi:aldehyde-activating protein [Sphingorhabdus lutea]|uniref:Aldehyde-activating protein n=2 Tax=Sphingorhabdus lutea TaxID=1913578 RepID=A0A1L3JFK7_9SPHN|nr:aldehyde-activating protein [Sphingorhabdus lutea]
MTKKGSCNCGKISFEVRGALGTPDACHCSQCRKQSGHYWVSTDIEIANVTIKGERHLNWYAASPKVRRGFCKICGSFLFWHPNGRSSIAIAMGAFDMPTNIKLAHHIFVREKGDYYDIADGLPQEE